MAVDESRESRRPPRGSTRSDCSWQGRRRWACRQSHEDRRGPLQPGLIRTPDRDDQVRPRRLRRSPAVARAHLASGGEGQLPTYCAPSIRAVAGRRRGRDAGDHPPITPTRRHARKWVAAQRGESVSDQAVRISQPCGSPRCHPLSLPSLPALPLRASPCLSLPSVPRPANAVHTRGRALRPSPVHADGCSHDHARSHIHLSAPPPRRRRVVALPSSAHSPMSSSSRGAPCTLGSRAPEGAAAVQAAAV